MRMLGHPFPHLDFLFRRQEYAFAGRAADAVAEQARAIPLLHIVLDLDLVEIAFVIEGSGDGRDDAVQFQHGDMKKGAETNSPPLNANGNPHPHEWGYNPVA